MANLNARNEQFEEICRSLGIPADRIGLVQRNLELKTKLVQRGNAMKTLAETMHIAFQHLGEPATCQDKLCAGIHEMIRLTEG